MVAGFDAWSGGLTSCGLSSSMIYMSLPGLRIFQMADTHFDLDENTIQDMYSWRFMDSAESPRR